MSRFYGASTPADTVERSLRPECRVNDAANSCTVGLPVQGQRRNHSHNQLAFYDAFTPARTVHRSLRPEGRVEDAAKSCVVGMSAMTA